MGTPICQAVFSFFSKFFRERNARGVCGFARSFWRSIGCADTPSVSKQTAPPPMAQGSLGWFHCAGVRWRSVASAAERRGRRSLRWGLYGFAGVRRGSAGVCRGTVNDRSLHWDCADSPKCCRDRWRVPRNAGDGVPYGGVCTGSPGCGGDRVGCAAERHGGRSLRTNFIRRAEASEQSIGPNGAI